MAKGTTGKRKRGGGSTAVLEVERPRIPIPESVQEVLTAKLNFAKQTQQMFEGARNAYHAFAEGVAASIGVPAGYQIDAEAMEFVPAPENPDDAETEQ